MILKMQLLLAGLAEEHRTQSRKHSNAQHALHLHDNSTTQGLVALSTLTQQVVALGFIMLVEFCFSTERAGQANGVGVPLLVVLTLPHVAAMSCKQQTHMMWTLHVRQLQVALQHELVLRTHKFCIS